jgi:hypothetical protein
MAAGKPTTPYDATEEEAEGSGPFIGFSYGLYEDAAAAAAAGTALDGGPFVGFPYALQGL